MFRHVVLMRWKDEVDPGDVVTALEELRQLPDRIDGIQRFVAGQDAGLAPGNHDLVVVADFADEAAYLNYRDHPAHVAVAKDHLLPLLAERAAIQHRID